MEFLRNNYLDRLVGSRNNGMIKVITGIRRCGKSYLLFDIFRSHLIKNGFPENRIIGLHFDDPDNADIHDVRSLNAYIKEQTNDTDEFIILLDEIQLIPDFELLLNGLLYRKNLDIYVTGSNSRFLSSDIITEFRGRGDEIRVYPLTFAEYYNTLQGDVTARLREYMYFGGLPLCALMKEDAQKQNYLTSVYTTIYLKDLKERHNIRNSAEFDEVTEFLASSIGTLTNPKKLSDTFRSVKKVSLSPDTITRYTEYLTDAFLIDNSKRFDIKGKKYISTPSKYYFSDCGIRNAVLQFRQFEPTHLMENIIYNELKYRGFSVDVGVVTKHERDKNGNGAIKQLEVDFVANRGFDRYYIQSAYAIPDEEKRQQEEKSLDNIPDSFSKVIITGDNMVPFHKNEKGYTVMNIIDFLLKPEYLK